MEYTNSGSF